MGIPFFLHVLSDSGRDDPGWAPHQGCVHHGGSGECEPRCALVPVCQPEDGQLGIRVGKSIFSTPMLPVLLGTESPAAAG
jgi:hypothetical protein